MFVFSNCYPHSSPPPQKLLSPRPCPLSPFSAQIFRLVPFSPNKPVLSPFSSPPPPPNKPTSIHLSSVLVVFRLQNPSPLPSLVFIGTVKIAAIDQPAPRTKPLTPTPGEKLKKNFKKKRRGRGIDLNPPPECERVGGGRSGLYNVGPCSTKKGGEGGLERTESKVAGRGEES